MMKVLLIFLVKVILRRMMSNLGYKIKPSASKKRGSLKKLEKIGEKEQIALYNGGREAEFDNNIPKPNTKSNDLNSIESLNSSNKTKTYKNLKEESLVYKIALKLQQLDNRMNLKFFSVTFLAFQLDFLMASFANFRFIKIAGIFGVINFIISSVIAVAYILLVILFFRKFLTIQQLRKRKNLKKSAAKVDEVESS